MPIFDHSASRPGCAEANLLRSVLGPAKPSSRPSNSFRVRLSRAATARERQARLDRPRFARTVLRLGSRDEREAPASTGCCAGLASGRGPSARSSTRQGLASSAGLRSLTEMTYCLWSEALASPPPPTVWLPTPIPIQEHSMPEVADNPSGLSNGRPHPEAAESPCSRQYRRARCRPGTSTSAWPRRSPRPCAFGLDPDPIIKAAGLDPRLFEDGANVIPHRALGRLCALSVARTQCRHFGLLVGERATILSLGLVGRLMLHSETFGDALRGLVAHLSVQDRVIVPSLAVNGDTAVFSYAVYQPETESADQITDGAIACTVNAIRALLGEDWAPSGGAAAARRPADAEPYRRHFRAPVRFDQEIAALVFPSRCLERRIAGADPLLRAMLEERIAATQGRSGLRIPGRHPPVAATRLTNDTLFGRWHGRSARHAPAHPGPPPGAGGTGYRSVANESPVRDRASVAGGHDGVPGPDRGGPRLFGGERLYAGLPALVRRDPDRLAGEAPPRRAAELTRAAKRLIPTRHRPGENRR